MVLQSSHIPLEQLAALAEGQLSFDEQTGAQAHVALCGHCAGKLARLTRTIALMRSYDAESPPPFATARLLPLLRQRRAPAQPSLRQRIAAVLHFDSLQQTLAPALRAGQPHTRRMLFNAGGWDVDLRIEPAGGALTISGQVLGTAVGGQVELRSADTVIKGHLNKRSSFSLPDVPPGSYTLVLHLQAAEIEIADLALGL